MPDLELDDIQGLLARGYSNLAAACYVLLRIEDVGLARSWLASTASDVTPGSARPSEWALNVALTRAGIQKLGLAESAIGHFPYEFRTGMATPHRQRMFGDVGPSAPDRWLWGGPRTPSVDVLLLLFARDPDTLARRRASYAAEFQQGGLAEVMTLEAVVDLNGKEHFGFTDGISQPTIDGLSSRSDIPPNTIAPGEFILGYLNEYGRYTDRPLLPPGEDPDRILPLDVEGSGSADFGRNGTYLVFRHLSQDVRGFWGFVDRATGGLDGSSDPTSATKLAATMVGRWPSGAPVTLTPDADDPRLASANDFTYQFADPTGSRCPIGSHVRRAHPRDSLDPDPGTVQSVALDKRHRLLRRGREYGPPVEDVHAPAPPDDPDRGLYFICLVGNIARQFEFVQATWLNNPKFDGLYDEPDPLVASHPEGRASFSVAGDPARTRYTNVPEFVTVRGGAYFFLPGIRALRYLGSLHAAA